MVLSNMKGAPEMGKAKVELNSVTTVGLDLAKHVFQIHALDADGKIVIAKSLRRKDVLSFFDALSPCVVGLEACGSAHHWARELVKLGRQACISLRGVSPRTKARRFFAKASLLPQGRGLRRFNFSGSIRLLRPRYSPAAGTPVPPSAGFRVSGVRSPNRRDSPDVRVSACSRFASTRLRRSPRYPLS
jgi:hypothetical protein